MKWEVSGADRNTGRDVTLTLDADDEASAIRRGNRRGLLVSSARSLDADDSVDGMQPTTMVATRPQSLGYQGPQRAERIPHQPTYVQVPIPVSTPKGMNGLEKIGVLGAVGCTAITMIGYGLSQAQDDDARRNLGGTMLAIGIIGLLVSLLVFSCGRMFGHR